MVAGSDRIVEFGGGCWLYGFDRKREKEREERDGRKKREMSLYYLRRWFILL